MARKLTGLALAILTIFAVAAPAHADAGAYAQAVAHAQHRHSIRCASLDACTTKDGSSVPCRSWRLDLLDDTHMRLNAAMVKALGAKGNRTLQIAWEAYRQLFTSNIQRAQALRPWLEYYNTRRRHTALDGLPSISRRSPTP
ncbi:integrase core domain-containing protein [Microbispora sp. H10830]|uniref:integrase core domain-containing protein n=1 Tax=Microbispora sp. H10830 TaxID=2729109 RepID=UPI0015FF06BB